MSGRYQQDRVASALWQAKLNALQQALGSNNFFHGTDFRNFLTNGDWQNYQYLTSRTPDPFGVSGTNRYLSANLPEYHLINRIRNAQDLDEVNRQLSLWKQYDPLNAPANIRNYIRMQSVGSVGTRPQFNINEPAPAPVPVPSQPPVYDGFGGIKTRREKLQEAIENSNANNPYLGGNYGSRRPGWGLVDENPQPQAPVKSAGKSRRVRQGRSSGNLSRSGSNTYATAGTPRGGVISPATMMRTSGVQPVQASYGNNAPMGEGFDYTRTYDPMSNSMRPNDSYSYYDPSRNAPSGGDGTDLTLTYDPMTGQMVRR